MRNNRSAGNFIRSFTQSSVPLLVRTAEFKNLSDVYRVSREVLLRTQQKNHRRISQSAAISFVIDKIDSVCQQNDGHTCIIDATIWPTAAHSAPPFLLLLQHLLFAYPSFIDSIGLVDSIHGKHEDSANASRSVTTP